MKIKPKKVITATIAVVFGIAALVLSINAAAVDRRAITLNTASMDLDSQTLSVSLIANKDIGLKTLSGTFPLTEKGDAEDKLFTLAEITSGERLVNYGATLTADVDTGVFTVTTSGVPVSFATDDVILTAIYNLQETTLDDFEFSMQVTSATFDLESDMSNEEFEFGIGFRQGEQKIEYQKTEITKIVGDEKFTNPLTVTAIDLMEGRIEYESSDEMVATVDTAGEVTILAVGETTIKATAVETETSKKAEASYVLTVKSATPEPEPEPEPEPKPEPEPEPEPEKPEDQYVPSAYPEQAKSENVANSTIVTERKPRQIVVDDADDRNPSSNNNRALLAGLAAAASTVAIVSLGFLIREILTDKDKK